MTKRTPSRFSDMTIRQIAEKLSIPVEGRQLGYAILEWELFSEDPQLKNITDRMLDEFEISMTTRGLAPTTAATWRRRVQNIIKRAQQGADWLHHRAPAGTARKTTPNRIDGTLRSYLHLSYFRLKLAGRSDSQKRNHGICLRQFDRYLGHTPKLADLTNEKISGAMQWLVSRGRAHRTANKLRDCLCALWRHLCQEGKVRKWPNVRPFPEPIRSPVAWTKTELSRLWRACESEPGHIASVPGGLWWLTLHSVLFFTAERIGAVLALQWSDVDLTGGFVKFRAETRKGQRADNVAKLNDVTIAMLRQFPSCEPDTKVFSWRLSLGSLYNHYRHILKRANLPADRLCKFHRVRKSAATWFEIAGGNATDLLMHSSRQVTQSYLDPRLIGKTHGVDLLFDPRTHPDALPAPAVGKAAAGGREMATAELMESGVGQ